MLDGDLVPVTGTYYSLFLKEISNIPTVTPSLLNQTCRMTRHNVSVTRYKSVIKKTAMTGRQPVVLIRYFDRFYLSIHEHPITATGFILQHRFFANFTCLSSLLRHFKPLKNINIGRRH